jgi:peptide/nickel transport system ATP-binding protein
MTNSSSNSNQAPNVPAPLDEWESAGAVSAEPEILLSVENLRVYFDVYEGLAKAVDGISFNVHAGEILGIVGESGCGKSVTGLSILRLLTEPPARVKDGRIVFKGRDLLKLSPKELRRVRGREIAMIFQEPQSALNPVFTIGNQMAEAILTHLPKTPPREVRERVVTALREVRIPEPESRLKSYPHELSGGMKQRVMIAMAMLMKPALLIADEPTTALDLTIQRQILDLIRKLQAEHKMAVIFITHDLGVVAQLCHRVHVMYAGLIAEKAPVGMLFAAPAHPYTQGLMKARPRVHAKVERLSVIPGRVPPAAAFPPGCRFAPRCQYATAECRAALPELHAFRGNAEHLVACIHAEKITNEKK